MVVDQVVHAAGEDVSIVQQSIKKLKPDRLRTGFLLLFELAVDTNDAEDDGAGRLLKFILVVLNAVLLICVHAFVFVVLCFVPVVLGVVSFIVLHVLPELVNDLIHPAIARWVPDQVLGVDLEGNVVGGLRAAHGYSLEGAAEECDAFFG